MGLRALAFAVVLALLIAELGVASARPPLLLHGAQPASPGASASAPTRQIVIFVPGINTRYELISPVPQTQGVTGFSTLKAELVSKQGYSQDDFIDFGYDPSAYLDGGIDLLPYTCEQSGQDIGLSGASLRQLVKNVHDSYPDDKIVLVGHSLGGVVITWALDGLRDASAEAAIGGVVTIDSPLYGARSDDVSRLYAAPAEYTQCDRLLTASEAATALAQDLDGSLRDGDRSAASVRLAGALQRFHDRGARIGTFGNRYDCVFNHVACGTLLTSILPGTGGLGDEDYSWTQVYPRGTAPLGHSRMYEFPDYWPGCVRIDVCMVESHGYLLAHPQQEMLETIGPRLQSVPGIPGASASPAVVALSVYEVVGRAQAAITRAGTYRFQYFSIDGTGRTPVITGEVDLQRGQREQALDGSWAGYYVAGTFYSRGSDGSWTAYTPPHFTEESLVVFLRLPATEWTLVGTEAVDGKSAYVIERIYLHQVEMRETIWIDAESFLPIKRTDGSTDPAATTLTEKEYSEFGAPVDVAVPAEALQPQATVVPTPTFVPIDPLTLDPQALFNLLHDSPFSDGELPTGFTSAVVSAVSSEDLEYGAVAGVEIVVQPSDHEMDYFIYATSTDAQQAYEAGISEGERQGLATWTPSHFAYPSVVASGFASGYAVAVCAVLVGNLLLGGASALQAGNQGQAETNAIDLARAGIAHLEQLVSNPKTLPAQGSVLFSADWTLGLDEWGGSNDWMILDEMLINNGLGDGAPLIVPYEPGGVPDYAIEADIQFLSSGPPEGDLSGRFGMFVRAGDQGAYWVSVSPSYEHVAINVGRIVFGSYRTLQSQAFSPEPTWHAYRLEAVGETVRFMVDGELLLEIEDHEIAASGRLGIWSSNQELIVRNLQVIAL